MLTIGVDIGGTSLRASVVDADGAIHATRRVPTADTHEGLTTGLAETVGALAAEHPVSAVGLAVAGFVSADQRVVRFAPHLPWRQVAVADELHERLGLPVVLEHDANAAAVAEQRFGAATDSRVSVLIALGTGIGGALVVDGELFRGAHGVAPEFGHLRLVPNGRPCSCGKQGCWERYCSGTALVDTAVELGVPAAGGASGEELTGVSVARAAEAGDPAARRAADELGRWLGEGLALVADVYDPEVVVITGGVSDSAPLFLETARQHYADVVTGAGHRPLADVRVARCGDRAALIGAAALARSRASSRWGEPSRLGEPATTRACS
ncbi:ROK family protein [Salinifilum aidingensis]